MNSYTSSMLFPTDEKLEEVIKWYRSRVFPVGINQKYRLFKYDKATKQLSYDSKIVVAPSQRKAIIEEVYKSNLGIGKGVVNLYKYLSTKYINIRRKDVADVLQSQPNYQMKQPPNYRQNKPIVSNKRNQIWAIDLLDMSMFKSGPYKFILVVVDVYSRMCWMEKLKGKTSSEVCEAFRRVMTRSGAKPARVMADNGGEFSSEFVDLCKEEKIHIIRSRSHTPQANSIVERANGHLRSIFKDYFIREGGFKGWSSDLPKIEEAKNTSYNDSIRTTAQSLYDTDEDSNEKITKLNDDRIKKLKAKFKSHEFHEGDVVRVKSSIWYGNIRKMMKNPLEKKKVVVGYTPFTLKVVRVLHQRGSVLNRDKYLLEGEGGRVYDRGGNEVWFYGSELRRATDDDGDQKVNEAELLALNQSVLLWLIYDR